MGLSGGGGGAAAAGGPYGLLAGAGLGAVSGLIKHNQAMADYNRQKELAAKLQESNWRDPKNLANGQSFIGKMPPSLFNDLLENSSSGLQMGEKNLGFLNNLGDRSGGLVESGSSYSPWSGLAPTIDSNLQQKRSLPNIYDQGRMNA